jgi:hypothetical protein
MRCCPGRELFEFAFGRRSELHCRRHRDRDPVCECRRHRHRDCDFD